MAVQTSYEQKPAEGRPGMRADMSLSDVITKVVDETDGIEPGLFVVHGATSEEASLPSLPAADDDAIIETGASAGTEQTLDADDFDGDVGAAVLGTFARQLKIDLDDHADWNATIWTLTYLNENGEEVNEEVTTADGGSAQTLTTVGYCAKLISVVIPAQAGAGGAFTLGTGAAARFVRGRAFGVANLDDAREDFVYADDAVMPVFRKGRVFVDVENAFTATDGVYVRAVATSPEKLGAVRAADDDSGDCVFFPHARFVGAGAAGLGVIELDL